MRMATCGSVEQSFQGYLVGGDGEMVELVWVCGGMWGYVGVCGESGGCAWVVQIAGGQMILRTIGRSQLRLVEIVLTTGCRQESP